MKLKAGWDAQPACNCFEKSIFSCRFTLSVIQWNCVGRAETYRKCVKFSLEYVIMLLNCLFLLVIKRYFISYSDSSMFSWYKNFSEYCLKSVRWTMILCSQLSQSDKFLFIALEKLLTFGAEFIYETLTKSLFPTNPSDKFKSP